MKFPIKILLFKKKEKKRKRCFFLPNLTNYSLQRAWTLVNLGGESFARLDEEGIRRRRWHGADFQRISSGFAANSPGFSSFSHRPICTPDTSTDTRRHRAPCDRNLTFAHGHTQREREEREREVFIARNNRARADASCTFHDSPPPQSRLFMARLFAHAFLCFLHPPFPPAPRFFLRN